MKNNIFAAQSRLENFSNYLTQYSQKSIMKKNIVSSYVARFSKRAVATLGLVSVLAALPAFAQEESSNDEDNLSLSLAVTSDAFFGFAPMGTGSYKLSDKLDFTFYGIFWSGGTGAAWGNWTEFGAGVNLKPIEGIGINPQIGIVSGNLLSSTTAGPAVFGDGVVPNLTINVSKGNTESQVYFGYYGALRREGDKTANYIHYWVNSGYKVTSLVSLGLHFEHLRFSGGKDFTTGSEVSIKADDVYQWFGPYVQFSKSKGFVRFAGGPDISKYSSANNSFFKLTAGYNF